jgi:hypothetical protein
LPLTVNTNKQTGIAGEFLVAANLARRGFEVWLAPPYAKGVDLVAQNPRNGKMYHVQVKTLQKKNCFPIKYEAIRSDDVYVFVLLKSPLEGEDYFIVRGATIMENRDKYFGASYKHSKVTMPAINYGPLRREHGPHWDIFES